MFITQRVSSVTTSILYESHQISKQESEIYTYLFSYICNQLLFTKRLYSLLLSYIDYLCVCFFFYSFIFYEVFLADGMPLLL